MVMGNNSDLLMCVSTDGVARALRKAVQTAACLGKSCTKQT